MNRAPGLFSSFSGRTAALGAIKPTFPKPLGFVASRVTAGIPFCSRLSCLMTAGRRGTEMRVVGVCPLKAVRGAHRKSVVTA